MTEEEAIRRLDVAVHQLCEFFPHVQIMVTWNDDRDRTTYDAFRGGGNWYARVGLAREFLTRDESQTTAKEIADRLEPPDEEAEV